MVEYRAVVEEEIPEAAEVYLTSLRNLADRTGHSAPTQDPAKVERSYRHVLQSGIFEGAFVDGRLVSVCNAILRDGLWFLSGFWTLPAYQRRGIGGPLLTRVWEQGEERGAHTFFTWASGDPPAMTSYLKRGMLPGYQVLVLAGTVASTPGAPHGYEARPLTVAPAAEIDERIRATGRSEDHAFWLGGQQVGRLVVRDGRPVGYYYVDGSTVGPAAWLDPVDAEAVTGMALADASADSGRAELSVPGVNHAAIRLALRLGLRFARSPHLLLTAPFGQLDRYVPSGPFLF